MTIWLAILLGVVQGLCEFLPVSSSGHLILLQRMFGVEEGALFFTVMQMGVPVALPLKTPLVMQNSSASLLAVDIFPAGRRSKRAFSMLFKFTSAPGVMPSIITVSASPWLSPATVTER